MEPWVVSTGVIFLYLLVNILLGVLANRRLRARLAEEAERRGLKLHLPAPILCTDNGAMIAMAGLARLLQNEEQPRGLRAQAMAAFALSKYQFKGRDGIFVLIISTLMVPISVILVPAFFVLTKVGLTNNLWGLIIPGAATPTGVFLLRQYMLTIPDDLIQSARIDGASEWRIYAQIMLPLTGPALAVLAIFSVMWRWNDFLWPLVAISQSELFTLQVGLRAFSGELNQQWNYILAMTVLTMLPITIVFALLEKYITTGIATTGMK